jgi:hypothetical protein
MTVTNQTAQDYWFGPLHLAGGVGQTLSVDDTSETSLYLTEDAVADAINSLYLSGKIAVSSAASPFPRPTGEPALLHGDGAPEGLVFAPQGSMYLRRDGTGPNSLYTKTTGITINTGWQAISVGSAGTTFRKTTATSATNTVTETDLLAGQITIPSNSLATTGIVRLTAWGDYVQNSGATTALVRWKLKLGATPTVVFDTGAPGSGTNGLNAGATRYGWKIVVEMMNTGAVNTQLASIVIDVATASGGTGAVQADFTTGGGKYGIGNGASPNNNYQARAIGYNAAAIDTTVDMNILLTVINPTATTCETKLFGALVELI